MTTEAPLAPWNVSPPEFPEGGEAAEKLTFLLRYAVLAPSGHNRRELAAWNHPNLAYSPRASVEDVLTER